MLEDVVFLPMLGIATAGWVNMYITCIYTLTCYMH